MHDDAIASLELEVRLLEQAKSCAPVVGQADTVEEISARVASLEKSIAALRKLGAGSGEPRVEREP
jgi:hypothetical protein